MTAVLDAGALIAIDRRDRRVGAVLRLLHQEGVPVVTSAGAVAQVWRNRRRQTNLARLLKGIRVSGLEELQGKKVGELLAAHGTSDIVDAHVALLAHDGDRVLTSDASDIQALLATLRTVADVIHV